MFRKTSLEPRELKIAPESQGSVTPEMLHLLHNQLRGLTPRSAGIKVTPNIPTKEMQFVPDDAGRYSIAYTVGQKQGDGTPYDEMVAVIARSGFHIVSQAPIVLRRHTEVSVSLVAVTG